MSASSAATAVEPAPYFEPWPISDYGKMDKLLGQGKYGMVHDTINPPGFAIKSLVLGPELEHVQLNEIAYPAGLHHPNVIHYYNVYIEYTNPKPDDWRIYLVMDLYQGDLVRLGQISLPPQYLRLMKQLTSAVAYLTSRNIIHRDIKPENVLFNRQADGNFNFVLADFGLSVGRQCLLSKLTGPAFTAWYQAPEAILDSSDYNPQVDVWALGLTFYYVFPKPVGAPQILFQMETAPEQLQAIANRVGLPNPKSRIYSEFVQMVDVSTAHPGGAALQLVSARGTPEAQKSAKQVNDILVQMLRPDPETRATIFAIEGEIQKLDPKFEIIEDVRCRDRVYYFERSFVYDILAEIQYPLADVVIRMLEVESAHKIKPAVNSLAVELFYKYLTVKLWEQSDRQRWWLILATCLYVANLFLGDVAISMQDVIAGFRYPTITEAALRAMIQKLLPTLDFDLVFTTVNDQILTYPDRKTAKLASKILRALSPFYRIYTHPRIARYCLNLVVRFPGRQADVVAFLRLIAEARETKRLYFNSLPVKITSLFTL